MTFSLPTVVASGAEVEQRAAQSHAATPLAELLAKPMTSALNPLVGSLTERIAYWKETNPAWAQAGLNGWDSVPKCLVACSMADGQQVHPGLFMQGNWAAVMKGKLVVIPKVTYILGLCRARVAGFRLTIVEDTADACEVTIYNGREEHRYRYTMADAKRQGLLTPRGGENAWTGGNTREMLQWKAIRRCADLACPEVMFGMSSPPEDSEEQPKDTPEAPRPIRQLTELETASLDAGRGVPGLVAPTIPGDWKEALRTEIRARKGGGLTNGQIWANIKIIRVTMGKPAAKNASEISEDDSREMVEFIRKNYPNHAFPEAPAAPAKAEGGGGNAAPAPADAAGGTEAAAPAAEPVKNFDEQHAEQGAEVEQDELGAAIARGDAHEAEANAARAAAVEAAGDEVPPPMEGESVPYEQTATGQDEERRAWERDGKIETLSAMVKAAKKSHAGVVFVREAAAGTGNHWFTHEKILKELGFFDSVRVGGEGSTRYPLADADTIRKLVRAMRASGISTEVRS